MDAIRVDALRFMDFCNYLLQIDAYWKARREEAKAGVITTQ